MAGASAVVSAQTAPQGNPPAEPAFKAEVIGTTPLPGVDLLLIEIPAPVQTTIERDVRESGALDIADFLNRRLNGVYVNEVQGNPFQADTNDRGYTASPLLGTPQDSPSTWTACGSISPSDTPRSTRPARRGHFRSAHASAIEFAAPA